MKKLYWRPQKVSLRVLLIVALFSVAGLISVESFLVKERQPYYSQKLKAAHMAERAFEVIREERARQGIAIDPETDPAGTGLVGAFLTSVTSNRGYLPAKQTSLNPNFAAVVVHLLKRAGVEEGDYVAVGLSGSFPAINIAVMAAIESLKLRPIIITSTAASQYGANIPGFLWPDMEKLLYDQRIIGFRSLAASRGGVDDRALGIPREGRQILDSTIQRNGLQKLDVANSFESIEKRVALYREQAGENDIKAYINVGGGTTSVGTRLGKKMFRSGLNRSVPRGATDVDSVMTRFALDGVPVIHMSRVNVLAARYGLPLQPTITPPVGDGKIFVREVHSKLLAGAVLFLILVLMVGLVRMDWGYRILGSGQRQPEHHRPEPMI